MISLPRQLPLHVRPTMGCGPSNADISGVEHCRKTPAPDAARLAEAETEYYTEFLRDSKTEIIEVVGAEEYEQLCVQAGALMNESADDKIRRLENLRPDIERIQQLMMDSNAFAQNSNKPT
eukprot:TRINITY_DN10599_c0_g1_i1.p2 TRINITY_DN10599_c0_g1~~TRINITY_DN10599_c0_g1_i1.p2  ORF type:complete len:121 (+),score=19.63 TRINITY_DN10599_c0_g1_i1:611-973(+)